MHRPTLFATLATLLALFFVPAAATAETPASPHAPVGGITFPVSSDGSPVTVTLPNDSQFGAPPPAQAATVTKCTICGPMSYHGGTVMPSSKVYTIFWGSTFPANYISTINQYFTDLAHDSGANNNVYSIATQFYNSTAGAISYNLQFAGTYTDSNAPTGSCSPYTVSSMGVNATTCVYGSEIEAEIESVISSQHWPADNKTEFFLFTPQGVGSQFGSPASPGKGKAYSDYCGYHSATSNSHIFANQPYAAEHGSGASFTLCEALYQGTTPVRPNNNPADGTLNVVAHELMESVTDSFYQTGKYAWTDSHLGTGEIADKCNFLFGKSAASATDSNQTINGHGYWLQEMYSNKGAACATSLIAASAANITITGTGFATSGVTVDVGTSTGLTPTKSTATSITLTGVQPPLAGSSQVDATVHSGGLTSTLANGYSWGPKITSVKASKGVITISGSGFALSGVTVDVGASTGLTPISSTASSIKVTEPTIPTSGSSETAVVVHSGGYTATLPAGAFWYGPHVTSAKLSKGVITITGTGFATSGVTVDLDQNNGAATFDGLTPTSSTATTIKLAAPAFPGSGISDYTVAVTAHGLTSRYQPGGGFSIFSIGPYVTSAKVSKGVITISGTGFATHGVTVDLRASDASNSYLGLTPTKTTSTAITLAEPGPPSSGSSEYFITIHSGGYDANVSAAMKAVALAFGPHVTVAK